MKSILVAHNLRSCHNVGSLLRTAEGLGVEKVFLTGYTPYPVHGNDERLPHIAAKIDKQIVKTALGAERLVDWEHAEDVFAVIDRLRADGWLIVALEQTPTSIALPSFRPDKPVALIVGREVEGVEPELIEACDASVEIPMSGQKESFNVASAAAMALYHLKFQAS